MATAFDARFATPLYTFEVLDDDHAPSQDEGSSTSTNSQHITVDAHCMIIGGLSDELCALITSPMKESSQRSVSFVGSGTRRQTFLKVCEFAYSGDYSIESRDDWKPAEPKNEAREVEHKIDDSESEQEMYLKTAGKKGKRKKKTVVSEASYSTFFDGYGRAQQVQVRSYLEKFRKEFYGSSYFDPAANKDMIRSLKLLEHARIYAFASQWNITKLRELGLNRFRDTLRELRASIVPEVLVSVATFVFQGDVVTGQPSTGEDDEIREVLARYVACEIKHLTEQEAFMEFFRKGGAFADAVLQMIAEELV